MCHWHPTFSDVNDRMTVFDSPRCLTRSNCLISISNSCKLTQQTARSYMKCNAGYRIAAGEALEVETANCFHNSPVRFLAVFFSTRSCLRKSSRIFRMSDFQTCKHSYVQLTSQDIISIKKALLENVRIKLLQLLLEY